MPSATDRPDRFEDERGVIQDLLGPVDAVTRISTFQGAVRGNHIHRFTTQWTYVVSGRLLAAWGVDEAPIEGGARHRWMRRDAAHHPGDLIEEPPGIPHAWQALEDTVVLVFTKGPRSGTAYEADTIRLAPEDRLIRVRS